MCCLAHGGSELSAYVQCPVRSGRQANEKPADAIAGTASQRGPSSIVPPDHVVGGDGSHRREVSTDINVIAARREGGIVRVRGASQRKMESVPTVVFRRNARSGHVAKILVRSPGGIDVVSRGGR